MKLKFGKRLLIGNGAAPARSVDGGMGQLRLAALMGEWGRGECIINKSSQFIDKLLRI